MVGDYKLDLWVQEMSREPRVSCCDPRKALRVLRRVLRPDYPTMTREQ